MEKPLVTILSPVYNGAAHLKPYLDSVLSQDYDNIEFILVNDGSTDDTDKIIREYTKKLKSKLTSFLYIVKPNGGAASALNEGLKKVTGKYITWPDSDDILMNNSISLKCDFLEKHPEYGFVRTDAFVYKEGNLNKPIYKMKTFHRKTNLFYNFLLDKKIYYSNGPYMARTECLRKDIPNMHIYESKYGQNWQFYLPLSYYEKCGYIRKVTYKYIEYEKSHSHGHNTYDKKLELYNGYEDIVINVLQSLKCDDGHLKKLINNKYSHIRLNLAIDYENDNDFKREYNYLQQNNDLKFKEKMYYRVKNRKKVKKMFLTIKKIICFPARAIRKMLKIVNIYI